MSEHNKANCMQSKWFNKVDKETAMPQFEKFWATNRIDILDDQVFVGKNHEIVKSRCMMLFNAGLAEKPNWIEHGIQKAIDAIEAQKFPEDLVGRIDRKKYECNLIYDAIIKLLESMKGDQP